MQKYLPCISGIITVRTVVDQPFPFNNVDKHVGGMFRVWPQTVLDIPIRVKRMIFSHLMVSYRQISVSSPSILKGERNEKSGNVDISSVCHGVHSRL